MCGLVALWDRQASTPEAALQARCVAMRDSLVHRGPDSAGVLTRAADGLALGHRRLAILDLSPAGHQPMSSPTGRWSVVFNGEIYNFAQLRDRITGVDWRGHSDTEVLTALLDATGFEDTLPMLRGMFAIAAWDHHERALWLGRDRLGQKPLYWHEGPRFTLVGSELRALRVDPACPTDLDPHAAAQVIERACVHQPRTILRDVHQVPPGGLVKLSRRAGATVRRWWSVPAPQRAGGPTTFDDALTQLEGTLAEAVRLRTLADVPIGVLLSGGVDSTLITALLAQHTSRLDTFTIAVQGEGHDESAHAAAIAEFFGTRHHTLPLHPRDALAMVPQIVARQDEPFGDFSLIPTTMVSQLARDHVTVAIGGDGGDESFGGYHRYRMTLQAQAIRDRIPRALRAASQPWVGGAQRRFEGRRAHRPSRLSHVLRRLDQLATTDLNGLYKRTTTGISNPALVLDLPVSPVVVDLPNRHGEAQRMMAYDLEHYLVDDILVKTDRASMAASLELRAPLLDHHVIAAAQNLDEAWTYGDGQGKVILKAILERHIPREMWDRPKQGFSIPLAQWLRAPLRDWAESLLDESSLRAQGIWHPSAVRRHWRALLDGHTGPSLIWNVLQIQAWHLRKPGS